MIAVITDIHANYDALRAVLDAVDRLKPEAVICLGDIVGYGPDPVACVDAVRERCDVTLCGNHDFALIYGAEDFNPVARGSLEYHRRLLMPRPGQEDAERRERWQFLKSLPFRHVRDEWLYVHGSPRNPIAEYMRKIDVLLGLNQKISENFQEVDWLCCVGHTHRPGVISSDMTYLEPEEVGGVYHPKAGHKAIVVAGSVGQPRDKDWRASFLTIEGAEEVRWHRVEYDVDAAIEKVLAAPGIDHTLAERLRQGR